MHRFLNVAAVNKHEITHPSCEQCGEVFANTSDLQIHMKSHEEENESSSGENVGVSAYQGCNLFLIIYSFVF